MSQQILNVRECPICRKEVAITKEKEGYTIICYECSRGKWGTTLFDAVTSWNSYADRRAKELADNAKTIPLKSATDIINEVRDAMCNDYCRYMHEGKTTLTPEEESFYEENGYIPQCDNCPLNRL